VTLSCAVARIRHPRLALLIALGGVFLVVAGVMALTTLGTAGLTYRIGVVGYLFVLFSGAGYIALRVARSLEDV
jgi:hypothetical protein